MAPASRATSNVVSPHSEEAIARVPEGQSAFLESKSINLPMGYELRAG